MTTQAVPSPVCTSAAMNFSVPSAKRNTKIVATLGPACETPEAIRGLLEAGANVFRLNFSHGTHAWHSQTLERIRREAQSLGRPVAVMQDLCGPKIRISKVVAGELVIAPGDELKITTDRHLSSGAANFAFDLSSTYDRLLEDLRLGDTVLVNDGRLEFEVTALDSNVATLRVTRGGPLLPNKGLNLPGVSLSTPAVTEKDWRDLAWAIENKVDYVALSFVRQAGDLLSVQAELERAGSFAKLIAKIERPEALEQMPQIIAAADGIMVARGDLGLETDLTRVPLLQKRLIELARQSAKPVITATQMLDSMVIDSTPTRAEVSDVANAILDGSDAIMLSNETATGKFPQEAVKVLHRIALSTEVEVARRAHIPHYGANLGSKACALTEAAASAALDLQARRVVVYSQSGQTARLIARLRLPMPVVAITNRCDTERQLALLYGVQPVCMPKIVDLRQLLGELNHLAATQGWGHVGDNLVVVSAFDGRDGAIDTLHVHQVR